MLLSLLPTNLPLNFPTLFICLVLFSACPLLVVRVRNLFLLQFSLFDIEGSAKSQFWASDICVNSLFFGFGGKTC